MVWKQDLAQLKAQLKSDEGSNGPPAPPVKPVPAPIPNQSLDDADLLFLRAMGGVAVPPTHPTGNPMQEKDSAPVIASSLTSNDVSRVLRSEDSSGDFNQALADLKGLRPLSKNPVFSSPSPSVAPSAIVTIQQSPEVQSELLALTSEEAPATLFNADADTGDIPIAPQEVFHVRAGPVLMHLAAGMTIEVDGTLDLRRHSLNDAKERLTERIRDGLALHWRTLLVTLGPNEALKQGFLAFLTTPQAQFISRYAQAPIPLGGAQAWVLYLGQLNHPKKEEA